METLNDRIRFGGDRRLKLKDDDPSMSNSNIAPYPLSYNASINFITFIVVIIIGVIIITVIIIDGIIIISFMVLFFSYQKVYNRLAVAPYAWQSELFES